MAPRWHRRLVKRKRRTRRAPVNGAEHRGRPFSVERRERWVVVEVSRPLTMAMASKLVAEVVGAMRG